MAIQFHRSGPVHVYFNEQELGVCENGVDISVQPFYEEIHTDSFGGLAGPFAEKSFMGAVASIQCLLTKFDATEAGLLTTFGVDPFKAAGEIKPVVGAFVFQDSHYGILDLKGTQETLQFDQAHVASAVGFNMSSRHKRYQVVFVARVNDPCQMVLFDGPSAGVSCED